MRMLTPNSMVCKGVHPLTIAINTYKKQHLNTTYFSKSYYTHHDIFYPKIVNLYDFVA